MDKIAKSKENNYKNMITNSNDEENTIENPSFDEIKERIIEELLVSIDDFCERYNTFRPSKKQLIEQYHRFKELWTASDIRYDVTFPLVNFESDIQQESSIGSYLQLAPFSSQEKTIIWNEHASRFSMQTMPISPQKFMNVKYRLNGIHHQKKDDPFRPFDAYEAFAEMDNVLTALRLLKEGDVGVPTIFAKGHISSWKQTAYSFALLEEHLIRKRALRYILKEIDLPSVRSLFNTLEKLNSLQAGDSKRKPHGDLTVALRRFNLSYCRDLHEDRLIDLTISLESTLLEGLRDELKYRLALRGAALLAEMPQWEPIKSKALLSAMYDARSGIVHNGQQLTELEKDIRKLQQFGIQPGEFPQQCENIVRDILRMYVLLKNTDQSVKQVNQELDERIVKNLDKGVAM
jgi:hypothetical protein